jgi:hypothetical protein
VKPQVAVLTPFDSQKPAVHGSGRVWWKRVLPIDDVEYMGRTLKFTRDYLQDLAKSFADRAYDQVPFQIADAKNTHTNDPERFRGEVIDFDVRDDGLYIGMVPTPSGERLLKENPRLGVSARIVENYARSDGKSYPAAIQHVLGTLDPRIPDLGPWEAVEMSNTTVEQVLDLSASTYSSSEGNETVPGLDARQQARLDRLLDLDDSAFEALMNNVTGDAGDGDDRLLTDEELAEVIAQVDDESLQAMQEEFEAEQRQPAQLSGGWDPAAIELAETQRQLGIVQRKMDQDAFKLEARKLADAGVPPYIVDMARPLLEGTGHVVELAGGQGVDAGLVMRRVLTEYSNAARLLDLGPELGTPMDEPDNTATAEQARSELKSRYRTQVGL